MRWRTYRRLERLVSRLEAVGWEAMSAHVYAIRDTPRPGWRERMTITVPEYAEIVGVGRNTAYESVRAGEVTIIKVRGRILVCVPPLLRKLGMAAE